MSGADPIRSNSLDPMRLKTWFIALAILVSVGCLKVWQKNSMFMQGYAVGERIERMRYQQRELAWLKSDVLQASSPSRLAKVARERDWDLVAWSTIEDAEPGRRFLIRLASAH